MKRILALLLALVMLLALTACGKDEEGAPTGESTGTNNSSITEDNNHTEDGTEDGTENGASTDDGTEDDTENGASTDDGTADGTEDSTEDGAGDTTDDTTVTPHTHSYSSKVTTAATCGKDGVKTFTCSCGDSYTEKIAATGHSWGEWKQTTAPSYTAKGEETRTCGSCSATEKRDVAQLTLDNIFKNYPAIITTDEIDSLGFFNSVNDLNVYKVFAWAIGHIEPASTSQDNLTYTYSVSSLNGFTNKYLGRTFDYSLAEKDNGSEKVVYDATAQTVTITYAGGMGGMDFSTKYVGYEQIDDNHFVVTYETNYDAWPTYDYSNKNVVIEIEKVNDNYIITAHKKA